MKNLKRVLSLALSGIMLVGVMTVGAFAADKDFTDKDEIHHTDAVNTLVTLNVINGKDDGSYDPTGSLTRAEMAKLIVYALNGGQEPVMSTKAIPTYTDIKGHWAEKYIEYCSNLGIVAGVGGGAFNPGGILTGSQAAKMMLVAMNYKSDVFGFTGADWEINVNAEANKAGLYSDLLGMDPSVTITRDNAAQLVYNGILSNTMTLTWGQNMSTGAITQNYQLTGAPLFSQKFNGTSYEGILTASGKWAMSGTNNKDYFAIAMTKINNVELPASGDGDHKGDPKSFKWAGQDLTDLAGECVKVLYNAKDKTVYGVYSVADVNTVVNTTSDKVSEVTEDTIKIDGETYDINAGFSYTRTPNVADTVKFVDNDGDGDIDIAITTPVSVHKVTFASSTSFTLDAGKGTYASQIASLSNKLADVNAYEGLAKNDIVLVYEDDYTAKLTVEKAELLKDVAVEAKNTTNGKWRVDSTWYNNQSGETLDLGNTIDLFAIGGVAYYAKVKSGTSDLTSVAMVVTYGGENGINGNQVKLLFSDGSTKVVTIGNLYKADETLGGDTHTAAVGDATDGSKITAGDLVIFEEDGGDYNLQVLKGFGDYTAETTLALNDKSAGTTGTNNVNQINDNVIADDAVVFFFKGTYGTAASANAAKVMTGKEIKSTTITACGTTAKAALTKATNGLTRVAAVALANTDYPTTSSFANYGYIVANPIQTKVDGKNYISYQVWNGETTETYKAEGSSAKAGFGEVIGYEIVDDETIKSVTKVDMVSAAVKGLDGNDIQFTGADESVKDKTYIENDVTFTLDGNTKYLYVDSGAENAEDIGQTGGSVALASEPADGVYVKNVLVQADSDKTMKLVVVDVNGKIALQRAEKTALTLADTNSLAEGAISVTVDGKKFEAATGTATDETDHVVKPGDAIVITNNDEDGKVLTYSVSDGTLSVSGETLAAGKSVTYYADGTALTITLTSLAAS